MASQFSHRNLIVPDSPESQHLNDMQENNERNKCMLFNLSTRDLFRYVHLYCERSRFDSEEKARYQLLLETSLHERQHLMAAFDDSITYLQIPISNRSHKRTDLYGSVYFDAGTRWSDGRGKKTQHAWNAGSIATFIRVEQRSPSNTYKCTESETDTLDNNTFHVCVCACVSV